MKKKLPDRRKVHAYYKKKFQGMRLYAFFTRTVTPGNGFFLMSTTCPVIFKDFTWSCSDSGRFCKNKNREYCCYQYR